MGSLRGVVVLEVCGMAYLPKELPGCSSADVVYVLCVVPAVWSG